MKKNMNPYDIDTERLGESKVISDPHEILKYKLGGLFFKVTKGMETREILEATGLDKSDLSRILVFNFKRFSIDRFVTLLNDVGYSVDFKLKKKK